MSNKCPIYLDKNGHYKVDKSLLPKEDRRNFINYTWKLLNSINFNKSVSFNDLTSSGYSVTIYNSFIRQGDVKYLTEILKDKARVTSNILHNNRDMTYITIAYNQNNF